MEGLTNGLGCRVPFLQSGTLRLRNANGLTAANLAHAQGFHECAQLLSNAENQLKQLNGFGHNGTALTHIQGSLLNRVANRKRHYDCSEMNHIKKARTDNIDFATKMHNGMGEEPESMHVESAPDNQSDGTRETAVGLTNGFTHQKSFTLDTLATNGHRQAPESPAAEPRSDMCGSLHLGGSPSSSVTHRPSWVAFASGSGEHLHYGYYHGFGDTAEDLEETSSFHEHNTTVGVERHYDQEVLSAMQLFHGS